MLICGQGLLVQPMPLFRNSNFLEILFLCWIKILLYLVFISSEYHLDGFDLILDLKMDCSLWRAFPGFMFVAIYLCHVGVMFISMFVFFNQYVNPP